LLLDLFTQHLREQQFSSESVRAQVLQVAHLSRWLGAAKLKAGKLTATTIDAYCREQQAGPRLRQGYRAALHRLLGILREQGICPQGAPTKLNARQRIEEEFKRFLAVERGLAPATLLNYVPFISQLLKERFGRGPIRLPRLRATDIIGFVQRQLPCRRPTQTDPELPVATGRYRAARSGRVSVLYTVGVEPPSMRKVVPVMKSLAGTTVD